MYRTPCPPRGANPQPIKRRPRTRTHLYSVPNAAPWETEPHTRCGCRYVTQNNALVQTNTHMHGSRPLPDGGGEGISSGQSVGWYFASATMSTPSTLTLRFTAQSCFPIVDPEALLSMHKVCVYLRHVAPGVIIAYTASFWACLAAYPVA